ncbi:UNVERIFIED_CONTAM: hypothetical protein O8I53_11760 [Campylobacter lari]
MEIYATVNGVEEKILTENNFTNNGVSKYYINNKYPIEKIRISFKNTINNSIVLGYVSF